MLPDSKDAFPKILYLDQNKWIDLGRAHYGRPEGEQFRDALTAVRKAVDSGKLIVPFSAVNIVEMQAGDRAEQRERLARFMVDLSRNHSILPFITVRPWEVRAAVYAFCGHPKEVLIRRSIVRRGLANAFGMRLRVSALSANDECAVLQEVESAENTVQHLLERGEDREAPEQLRMDEASVLGFQEQVRRRAKTDITPEQRYIAELFDQLLRGDVGKTLVETLLEIGLPVPGFFDRFTNAAEFVEFFSRIPTLDVELALTVARDQDLIRPIDRNDTRDLIWLSVAVPCGNLVVSEKYWGHMARSRGLDAKYGTTIITDAQELPFRLTEMGCL